ncbi:helix-turn-helix transcriptional regulator [Vibrio sp. 10N.222.54.B12]|jgi:transcriptional regulator with XRE-family HTH domain|uniref:helix-turn-helix transcriptional regulator n=1 Tax=unclassified Vibrio TaxID=2614977 RepID=UPI0010BCF411|nr:helix-turn-helix domain-containing protein [Vibrio sp. F13]TKF72846.1 helix-turn-helix transcriptional regulator [Vibrio sp. F13]TKF88096.1 helix-turn-helix transcriptional regulator [Vibrio sp. F13]
MRLTFSQFLEYVRADKKLTQQEMVDLLSSSDADFSKLDLTTFSRWERGVTSPKLSKQLLIARLMDEDVLKLIDPDVEGKIKNKRHFEKMTNRILQPYSTAPETFSHYYHGSLAKQHSLCEQLVGFHQNYMGICVDAGDIQQSKMGLNTFSDSSSMLVGHLLYGFVPIEQQASSLNPNQLSACPFVDIEKSMEQPVDLYVISTFGTLPTPRMVSIMFMLDILCQNTRIKNLVLNCHDQEAYALFEAGTDYELVSKGNEIPFGGVKVFGKNYQYAQIRIKSESILASKLISSMLPFIQDHMHNLLGD